MEEYILKILTYLGQADQISGKVECNKEHKNLKPKEILEGVFITYQEHNVMKIDTDVRRDLIHEGWQLLQDNIPIDLVNKKLTQADLDSGWDL